jgi:3-carboxy-cis,cis-muconate cycloisomerase
MRPSSSPSERHPFGGLLDQLSGSPSVDAELSDMAWLRAALDCERALVTAAARAGLVPPDAASAVAAACDAQRYDVAEVGRLAVAAGNPVVPLARALSAAVPTDARPYVHLGATSQDVMDTAMSLVAHRALEPLLADLEAAADNLHDLADRHRATALPARTLLQQAVPTTFGLKCAGWLVALDEARGELARLRAGRLAVQLGGAGGTLSALGDSGPAVLAHLAEELGLVEPVLPWHTDRTAVGQLAAGLGLAAATLGKIGLDVVLLAQTEVGEVAEGDASRGG